MVDCVFCKSLIVLTYSQRFSSHELTLTVYKAAVITLILAGLATYLDLH